MNKTVPCYENPACECMTLRDYFAAHAPHEIPKWFEPVMPEPPKKMAYPFNYFGKDSRHPHRNLFMQYWNEETEEWHDNGEVPKSFKEEVVGYTAAFQDNVKDIAEWQKEHDRQRIYQWPWCYADGMISLRVKDQEQEVSHG